MEKVLEHVFPVWSVEGDCIVSAMGDFTLCFEVSKPEVFTLSEEQFDLLHQTWVRAIRLLPANAILHMQDWYTSERYSAHSETAGDSFLGRASERHFHERPYLQHRSYLFITCRAGDRKAVSSASSSLLRRYLVPEEGRKLSLVLDFIDLAEQFVQVLADCKLLRVRRMKEEEIWSYAGRPGVLEQYCYLASPGETSVIRDVSFNDGIHIGERECQLFTLADAAGLPASCSSYGRYGRYSTEKANFPIGMTTVLGPLLGCDHLYNQYLFLQDTRMAVKNLEARQRRLRSLSAHARENAISCDAVNAYLNEAAGGGLLPVKAHFNILAWTDGPGNRKEVRNRVSSALAQLDIQTHIETVGAPQIWYAGIPGNAAELPVNEQFDLFAEQAVCFFNQETNYRSSVSPVGLRLGDRISGRPLHVDISDEPMRLGITTNRNKFIIGGSGAGKSFFCNSLLRTYYEQGAHILLVDVGHSYAGLCQLLGGKYFTYSLDDPMRFNPFVLAEGERLDSEKRESIKSLLLALWKKSDESFNRAEYVALSNALQLYYDRLDNNKEIFACSTLFMNFCKTILSRCCCGIR
jgi:conjugation system TraG family ATPase